MNMEIQTFSEEEEILQIKFKNTLTDFLDELISNFFPTETELIFMRMMVKQAPASDLIGKYIRDILPLKNLVKEQNDAFFIDNNILYVNGNLSSEKENHFKNLWRSDILDEENRNTIWEWMKTFITIAQCYDDKYPKIIKWKL